MVDFGELPGTPALRAQTMQTDYQFLKANGFKGWLYWYCNVGPDGRAWKFTDSGSEQAWASFAAQNTEAE